MDMQFASCSYFYILKEKEPEFIPNPFHDKEGPTAPLVVQWLKEQGITRLITGEMGSIDKHSLKKAHINTVLFDYDKNTIQMILNMLK